MKSEKKTGHTTPFEAEYLARRRLMLAAPDLLAACEAYLYGRADNDVCESMMRAAIAKAKGTE